ncbi:MAG: hypothetical protein OSJ70_06980 [Bacilli bacterium]|nr:hypothetical protein [Bacilli bacterium]
MNLPGFKKTEPKYIQLDKEKCNLSFIKENVPKVIFKNSTLETNIGQWLEVLASKEQRYVADGVMALVPISASKLLDEGIAKDQEAAIAYTFGFLLKQLGVPETETCVLDNYDEKKFSCSCSFAEDNDVANLSFRWGDMMDFLPELCIDFHNAKRNYEYYAARDGKKPILSLQSFTVVNPKNSNTVYSFLSPFETNYKISNGDTTLSINIKKPESLPQIPFNGYVFRLKNDEALVKYLLDVSFPIELDQVYKKLCEISLDFDLEYPSVHLIVKKGVEDENRKITDEIHITNGKLKIFTLTKNGKMVSVDEAGNTVYQDKMVAINQHNDGSFEYHLNVPSREKIASLGTIDENLDKALKEVADIRSLAKTISGKDI